MPLPDAQPAKEQVNVRLAERGREWLDDLAAEYHVTRTDVVRNALAVAKVHEKDLRKRLEEHI